MNSKMAALGLGLRRQPGPAARSPRRVTTSPEKPHIHSRTDLSRANVTKLGLVYPIFRARRFPARPEPLPASLRFTRLVNESLKRVTNQRPDTLRLSPS